MSVAPTPRQTNKKNLNLKCMSNAKKRLFKMKIFYAAVVWMSKGFLNLGSVAKGQARGCIGNQQSLCK